ncbi:MAG: histidinol dehydrogenase, partial [bacterium]|nr:histidinol dehydrogenase [bacterium]
METNEWAWRRVNPDQVESLQRDPVDSVTLSQAATIVDAVRHGGEAALREYAQRFGDIQNGAPLYLGRLALEAALERIDPNDRSVMERTADRIEAFARAQRDALSEATLQIEGGTAGHSIAPIDRAGCYAP